MFKRMSLRLCVVSILGVLGFSSAELGRLSANQTHIVSPGEQAQYQLQERLIEAEPGDTIQLEAGRYELRSQLDVVADNVTIRGRGSDQTILSFRGQTRGGQGIEATGNNFVLEGLAIEDTAGNAVKVLGARNVTFRDVRAEWTGPPSAKNGAYGLYPVECQNVLLENCSAFGASDAGLYVGQCRNVIVRGCRAERNVAGIEIENTVDADVFDNLATNNSGGILVFDLPGLPLKGGRHVRLFRNKILANNHPNFADPGSTVAAVPPGTGAMVLATDSVEVFDNQIERNQTASVLVISYLALGTRINDLRYDPIPEFVSIHDNHITEGGRQPSGALVAILKPVLGDRFPDILWDGVVPDGTDRPRLHIANNGSATFVNFKLSDLSEENIRGGKYAYDTDLSQLNTPSERWKPVELRPHELPAADSRSAAQVYRSLPKKLSEFGLFQGELCKQIPAAGVILYDLNTTLFSDYSEKRRFLKVPEGTRAQYREQGVLDFPVGTVIAKTFSYPHDLQDRDKGERLLETRIEWLHETGWYGVSYIWNEEQTEAILALGGGELAVEWAHFDGTPRHLQYQVPNANQCITCHSQEKRFLPIGPTARNLNRPLPNGDDGSNQLAHWAQAGILDHVPSLASIERFPSLEDPHSGTIAARARAWLDVNCAHCHNPNGTARTSGLDLRWDQQDLGRLGVWKRPVAAGHGSGGRPYDIVPGKPDESILVYRLGSEDLSSLMPNLGRQLVHEESLQIVRQWIEGLPAGDP